MKVTPDEAPLIQIVHRAAKSVPVPVNEDRALHLRAERHPLDIFGLYVRF